MAETDKIFKEFKEHSVAEFFKKNRQMLGFSGKTRSLTTVVHELVSNSLDACEEANILPEIKVNVDEIDKERYRIHVEDNGPGIPKKHLGKALGMMLAGTKFHRFVQQRGQQGIGAAGCTMFAQVTTGKPVKAVSGYNGKVFSCEISVDFKTNKPLVANMVEEKGDFRGLKYTGEFAGVKYDKSSYSIYEYLKRTALSNPHAEISLTGPSGEQAIFPRSVEEIPPRPKPTLPHPLGISTNDLMEYAHSDRHSKRLSASLQAGFQRMSAGKIAELKGFLPEINFNKPPRELAWVEAEKLVAAFEKVKWIAPATDTLIPIGKEQVEQSLTNILNPEFFAVTQRSPKIYRGGIPFIVEAAIAYGGNSGRKIAGKNTSDLIRYANRAPLLFDTSGCGISDAVKKMDWKRYNLKNFDEQQVSVFVNFVSVHIPYTGAGKQAISPEDEVVDEIKNALMEVARQLQRYLGGLVRDRDRKARRKAVLRYVKQLSIDLADLAEKGDPEKIEKSLTNLIETKYAAIISEEETEIAGSEEGAAEEGIEEEGEKEEG